jgi:hypothetical protein
LLEEIFRYLRQAGKGVRADRILADVLKIQNPDPDRAEGILTCLLGQDPRFTRIGGLWELKPARAALERVAVLHVGYAKSPDRFHAVHAALRLPDGEVVEFDGCNPSDNLRRCCAALEASPLVVWSAVERRVWNVFLQSAGLRCRGKRIYLQALAARALKRPRSGLLREKLAAALNVPTPDNEKPREVVGTLYQCWLLLLTGIPVEFCRDLESLTGWITAGTEIDFSRFAFDREFLRQLPGTPGVYMMKNRAGRILYVGKSRNLRSRVSSYFTPQALLQPKIARIHRQLHSIDTFTVENEIEALLMEMRMIKDFRPVINLQSDVHVLQSGHSEERNLLLFVLETERDRVQVYLLSNGVFAGRQAARLGRVPPKRLCSRIKSVFFAPVRGGGQKVEPWEKEIVLRWFKAQQQRLNYLDVDQAGDLGSVLSRVRDYLADPDRLSQKIYYR